MFQEQDEYPVDRTLVCTGLPETTREDIRESAQDLISVGLGLVHTRVENATRLRSRNDKPGLVKIRLPCKDDKIAALRCKRNLPDTGYRRVFLRSSMTHSDRLMQQNLQTILKELPHGDSYRVTANGKLVKKDPPVELVNVNRGATLPTGHIRRTDGHH